MKLTTTTMVSVDGVMQGLGGPDEDRRGGFERGGWVTPYADAAGMAIIGEIYQRADAFLFGRRTYEIFAGSWGTWDDPGDSPIWTALNTQPKYVASTTLSDPQWANTTDLRRVRDEVIRRYEALIREFQDSWASEHEMDIPKEEADDAVLVSVPRSGGLSRWRSREEIPVK